MRFLRVQQLLHTVSEWDAQQELLDVVAPSVPFVGATRVLPPAGFAWADIDVVGDITAYVGASGEFATLRGTGALLFEAPVPAPGWQTSKLEFVWTGDTSALAADAVVRSVPYKFSWLSDLGDTTRQFGTADVSVLSATELLVSLRDFTGLRILAVETAVSAEIAQFEVTWPVAGLTVQDQAAP